jgi:hypothetical protein
MDTVFSSSDTAPLNSVINCCTTGTVLFYPFLTASGPRYIDSARTAQRTLLPTALLLLLACLLWLLPSNGSCLHSHYLATAVIWLLISRSLSSNGSTCHNSITTLAFRLIMYKTARATEKCFDVKYMLHFSLHLSVETYSDVINVQRVSLELRAETGSCSRMKHPVYQITCN